jgi:hypothetical protein
MKKTVKNLFSLVIVFAVLFSTTPISVFAASIQNAEDTMSTQKVSADASHVIEFNIPNALASSGTITLTFPGGFSFTGVTTGDITASGATVGIAGNVVTLTYASGLAANALVTITANGTNKINNPATANTYVIAISASNGDSGEITVPILNDDQVVVTAKVAQTLNFAVSDNSVGFGNLSSSSNRYATGDTLGTGTEPTNSHTLTAGTNATGGYSISVMGDTLTANNGSGDTITRIADASAPAAGSEQFGLDVDYASGGATPTVAAPFNDYGMTDVATTAEPLSTQTNPTADNVYDVNYVANIAATTEAGQYTTTFTYTMTANF